MKASVSYSNSQELKRCLPLWYAVCTLSFFCSLCLTRTGHPEIPQISRAASRAGLDTGQAAGREHAASLPSSATSGPQIEHWGCALTSQTVKSFWQRDNCWGLVVTAHSETRRMQHSCRFLPYWLGYCVGNGERLVQATPDVCITADYIIGFSLNFY